MFDGSEPLTGDDRRVMEACRGLNALALVNKADLMQVLDAQAFASDFKRVLSISAHDTNIMKPLTEVLTEMVGLGAFDSSAAIVANTRQRAAVMAAAGELPGGGRGFGKRCFLRCGCCLYRARARCAVGIDRKACGTGGC